MSSPQSEKSLRPKRSTEPKKSPAQKKRVKKPPALKPTFPVDEIFEMLRKGRGMKQVSATVSLYLGAVHEYLTTEILELAGNHAVSRGSNEIQVRDVLTVIHSDPDLERCIGDITP